jgi:hypothetical protein
MPHKTLIPVEYAVATTPTTQQFAAVVEIGGCCIFYGVKTRREGG